MGNFAGVVAILAVVFRPSLVVPHVQVPDIRHLDWEALHANAVRFLVFDKDKRKVTLIRQNIVLNLDGALEAYKVYTRVLDKIISVKRGDKILNHLLTRPPIHSWWRRSLYNGICSFTLCATQFHGSFIDAIVAFVLGAIVTALSYAADHSPTFEDVYE